MISSNDNLNWENGEATSTDNLNIDFEEIYTEFDDLYENLNETLEGIPYNDTLEYGSEIRPIDLSNIKEVAFFINLYNKNKSEKIKINHPYQYQVADFIEIVGGDIVLKPNVFIYVAKYDNEYLGCFVLTEIVEDLNCSFHGFINNLNYPTKKFNLKQIFNILYSEQIFVKIFEEIFNSFNISSIDAFIPRLYVKKIRKNGKYSFNALDRLLLRNGFHRLSEPILNSVLFNSVKRCEMYVYQVNKYWFTKNKTKIKEDLCNGWQKNNRNR